MAFLNDLSAFSQGFSPELKAMMAAKQQQDAEAALMKMYSGGGMGGGAPPPPLAGAASGGAGMAGGASGMPQPPMPGAPPPMPPPGGGAGGMPPQGPGGVSALPPGAMGGGGGPPGAPPPPMMPPQSGGAPPPPMGMPPPGGQPQGGAPPPMSGPPPAPPGAGAGNQQDPIQAAQMLIQTMVQSIKASNPGIKPHVLLQAVQSNIDMVKGVAPQTLAAAKQALSLTEAQMRSQTQQSVGTGHDQARMYSADSSAESRDHQTDTRSADQAKKLEAENAMLREKLASMEKVAGGHDTARIRGAQIGADSRVTVGAGHDAASDRRQSAKPDQAGAKRITADIKRIKDLMASYKASKGGMVPDGDPLWQKYTAALDQANAAAAKLQAGGGGGGQPPVPGARKAPDGKWYVKDPNSPSGWSMVN